MFINFNDLADGRTCVSCTPAYHDKKKRRRRITNYFQNKRKRVISNHILIAFLTKPDIAVRMASLLWNSPHLKNW